MPRLVRIALRDLIGDLPVVAPLRVKKQAARDSLFLCALGFEPRCTAIPAELCRRGYRADKAIYFRYPTNQADNATNLEPLLAHLHEIAPIVEPLDVDTEEFTGQFRTLLAGVAPPTPGIPSRVMFDISVAANRLIIRAMSALLLCDIDLSIGYAEAKVYHPTKAEYDANPDAWASDDTVSLEHGVAQIGVSPDHPGHNLDPLPDCVVLFPSFRKDRSRAVISHIDPSLITAPAGRIIWLLGVPHLSDDIWRVDAMRRINDLEHESTPQHNVSTFDYRETIARLDLINEERWQDYRLTISPLGSKMQSLGVSLFCYVHPEPRIVFAVPCEYNARRYSEEWKALWQVDFGSVAVLRGKLDTVDALRIQ